MTNSEYSITLAIKRTKENRLETIFSGDSYGDALAHSFLAGVAIGLAAGLSRVA